MAVNEAVVSDYGKSLRRPQKHRPDIADGYYCFPQGSHLILLWCDFIRPQSIEGGMKEVFHTCNLN